MSASSTTESYAWQTGYSISCTPIGLPSDKRDASHPLDDTGDRHLGGDSDDIGEVEALNHSLL